MTERLNIDEERVKRNIEGLIDFATELYICAIRALNRTRRAAS